MHGYCTSFRISDCVILVSMIWKYLVKSTFVGSRGCECHSASEITLVMATNPEIIVSFIKLERLMSVLHMVRQMKLLTERLPAMQSLQTMPHDS